MTQSPRVRSLNPRPFALALGLVLVRPVLAESGLKPSGAGLERPLPSLATLTDSRAQAVPALMQAGLADADMDPRHYWVSEKLDGVRVRWTGQHLITRGGLRIAAPVWFVAELPAVALDGELWMGRGRFEELSGQVRRHEPDESAWREIRFMVFDLPGSAEPFEQRLADLRRLFAASAPAHAALIEQFQVRDSAALQARLRAVIEAGGEGLMLHRADGRYTPGRSQAILKLKPRQDAEARVIAHLPGKGRFEGMLGALLVEDEEGMRFRIGTGFSDAERRAPPPIGSWVTFTHQGFTERGIPRFASFERLRPPGL